MALTKKRSAAVAEKPAASRKSKSISIAHPAKKETVAHPTYTFQVAAAEPATSVELLIDEGGWQPCREALGLWWYDWSGYHASEHKAVARLHRPDGTIALSELRIFEVSLT
jgi:hypothetical protein